MNKKFKLEFLGRRVPSFAGKKALSPVRIYVDESVRNSSKYIDAIKSWTILPDVQKQVHSSIEIVYSRIIEMNLISRV